MKPSAIFDLPIRHKPWRPSHLRWVMQDLAGVARQPENDHRTHLRATLEWVCRAQDACRKTDCGLIAAGWSFESGWLPASEDATGWLIETLLPAARYLDWPNLSDRAQAMLDALLAQPDQGAVGRIHGLVAGHVQLGRADSLARAVSSAHLLAAMPFTSPLQQTRAAHALAAAGTVSGDTALLAASREFLQATLAQQTPCGWFPESELPVTTSVLSGILRSLVESARLLDDADTLRAAHRIADGLRVQLQSDGRLAGAFDDGWMPAAKYFLEELGVDVNVRDADGFTALHHAAARGDNDMVRYLVSKGANVMAVNRAGQTTVDMANSPEQRTQPFPETIALLEGMGAKNNHNCQACK